MRRRFNAAFTIALGLAWGTPHAAPVSVTVRNGAGQALADAVVAVEVAGKSSHTNTAKADMSQRDRQFDPAVLVVQTGTAVSFPNFDTVRHHVYSFSPVKVIDIKLYKGTPSKPEVFDKPGIVALGCNIHDRMSAHIVVVDTPLFTKTDAEGRAQLDLPPGEHVIKAWHPSLKSPQLQRFPMSISANVPAPVQLVLTD